ncbi:MAG TPA: putative Fe-S cluster assembly protein SufT [Rubrivivax sp.]|nr:putative Fe-S cluster assembly protein SufT [Rubrivivax sp.]
MRKREAVVTTRPVRVEVVPQGHILELPEGTAAMITQALGGSFTLLVHGQLVRLRGADADAIGKEPPSTPTLPANAGPEDLRGLVWDTLKTCYDPEIPVDIVELGLVYVCDVLPNDDGKYRISIKMTLTAPGCGMGEAIAAEATDKLLALPGVESCEVEVVFDPPWERSMMSEAAQLQLGL